MFKKLFFSDLTQLVRLGERRHLQADDLPPLPTELHPQSAPETWRTVAWTDERRLLPTLLWASRDWWWFAMALYAGASLTQLLGPVAVNQFISRLQVGFHSRADVLETLAFGVAIGGLGIAAGLFFQHYFHRSLKRQQVLVNAVNTRLFQHSLKLTKNARENVAIGDIVNHMSSDTEAVANAANAVSDFVYALMTLAGAIGLLFYYLGPVAIVALVLMSILAPLTKKVSRDFTNFDELLMRHRDRRVSLMSQILSAIRLVKSFAWEKSVSDEVARERSAELNVRRRIARAELVVTLLYVAVGTFVLFAVLAVYTWRGGILNPALVFTCVSLFTLLEEPFVFMSRVITNLISARVASGRIARFLALPEVQPYSESEVKAADIRLEQVDVTYPGATSPSLRSVDLVLASGSSLAIVGPVGSGKSTLLYTLLGELKPSAGVSHALAGRGAFVPQEAYILNANVRVNLTFGATELSESEVQNAIELAALGPDLARLNAGLDTEIGERGVNLSGGQKQRLSLARAVLQRPDWVLLDDPLSAVDVQTEERLIDDLIFGAWRNVTRVIVTHRLNHLHMFDRVAFMNSGQIVAFGSYDEVLERSPEFAEYMREHARADGSVSLVGDAHVGSLPAKRSPEQRSAAARITEDEERETGAVAAHVYWDYVRSLSGGAFGLVLLALAAASGTIFQLLEKFWLAFVSNVQAGHISSKWLAWLEPVAREPLTAIYVYGFLGLFVMAAALSANLYWLRRGLAAGRSIHDGMLKSVLGASVRFFDSTPIGRVLQRFSRDMEAIDIELQWTFEHSMKCLAEVLITLVMIVLTLPWVTLAIVPVLAVYYRVQKLYRLSAREVKRLDSISRSPRYAHFKETLQGLVVIRAFGRSDWFLNEFYRHLAFNQRMFHGHYMVNRWFSSRIPVIGGVISVATTFAIVGGVYGGVLSPGLAGVLTVSSLSFWGILNWGIRIWSDVEARMTSLERVKFYSRLPQEQSVFKPSSHTLPLNWPSRGQVDFDQVELRYAAHLPKVLNGLSFKIEPGERVGVVGRTGSGKSTLIQALYRFVELEGGSIRIDGVDIATVPLERLRRALAIIPQDPVLFLGSLRANLDRFGEFTDERLWQVLERTSLAPVVRALPGGLNAELTENGANLSQGQRQLLCLARALLIEARVIVLDEATASVDVHTDARVQRIVREACQDVTMIIIAHRLGTVSDCDQIFEVAAGSLARTYRQSMSSATGMYPASPPL